MLTARVAGGTGGTQGQVAQRRGHKIRATAAHRSQYPIDPTMFPEPILQEMFGVEHVVRILPLRALRTSLIDD